MKTLKILRAVSSLGFLAISLATIIGCKEAGLPVLMTMSASEIKASSALLSGQIISDGGAEITSKGICWGPGPGPDITGSKKVAGSGTGNFTCILTGLNPNTLYYFRAFATNSEGIAYGEEEQFRTLTGSKPEVETVYVTPGYFAISAGVKITNDGGLPITEKGICLSTMENPTITDKKYSYDAKYPYDTHVYYMCYADQLNPKTSYHIRAFAINTYGISYGDDETVTTWAVPEISTESVTGITRNSAIINGNVTSLGDYDGRTEVGIYYGKDPKNYDLNVASSTSGLGKFTCNLTNLESGVHYYVRTYVAWDYDNVFLWYNYIVHGNEQTFTTLK